MNLSRFRSPLVIALLASALPTQAAIITFNAVLSGAAESPPNASPATGTVTAIYDSVAHTLALSVNFSGLTGTTSAAHIHAPTATPFTGTAGVATTTPTFAGFPSGVTSGTYAANLDLTVAGSYNPTFVTNNGGTAAGAEAALVAALNEGRSYFNIHTTTFPGGEIRGFLAPVPDQGATALMFIGTVGGLLGLRRRFGRVASV